MGHISKVVVQKVIAIYNKNKIPLSIDNYLHSSTTVETPHQNIFLFNLKSASIQYSGQYVHKENQQGYVQYSLSPLYNNIGRLQFDSKHEETIGQNRDKESVFFLVLGHSFLVDIVTPA